MQYLSKSIPYLILASILAIYLRVEQMQLGSKILMISMLSLAMVLFINAYMGKDFPKGAIYSVFQKFSGISLAVLTIGVLFRFLYWKGWPNMLLVGGISSIGSLFIFARWEEIKAKFPEAINPLKYNYILPLVFLGAMAIICFSYQDKAFYETFSPTAKTKSYEQFKAEHEKYNHKRPQMDSTVNHQ